MMMRHYDTPFESDAEESGAMTRPERFDDAQRRALHAAFMDGEALRCPVCDLPLDRRKVPPRPDVSYVRDRLWVSCPRCHRTTVLDRREPR